MYHILASLYESVSRFACHTLIRIFENQLFLTNQRQPCHVITIPFFSLVFFSHISYFSSYRFSVRSVSVSFPLCLLLCLLVSTSICSCRPIRFSPYAYPSFRLSARVSLSLWPPSVNAGSVWGFSQETDIQTDRKLNNKAAYTAYAAPRRPKSKSITNGPTDQRTDGHTLL